MIKLSYLVALILILGIIFIYCEKQPTVVEDPFPENQSEMGSLSKIIVLVDENYKEDWAMLYCPEGTPDCELPECVEVPCLQECLEISGTSCVHQKSFIDASGAYHVQIHMNDAYVKGIGLETGTKYVCPNRVNTNFYRDGLTPGNFPYKYHHKENCLLISQGDGPNYQITFLYHITINANGEITVRHVIDEIKCE